MKKWKNDMNENIIQGTEHIKEKQMEIMEIESSICEINI